MKSTIEEEICPVERTSPPKIKKPKGRRKKKTPDFDGEIAQVETVAPPNDNVEKDPPEERPKSKELTNVKCMECHCVGTVMKTIDGLVLFPKKWRWIL